MKQQSLIFSDWSVRQILNGAKTQTRRVLKPQPESWFQQKIEYLSTYDAWCFAPESGTGTSLCVKRKFKLGEIVWVREVWGLWGLGDNEKPVYRATAHLEPERDSIGDPSLVRWKPSILMPRRYSRLLLKITHVHCELLQNITKADAIAEGTEPDCDQISFDPLLNFRRLWNDVNGKSYPWSSNPFVWVLSFKIHKNGGSYGIQ